MAKGNEASWAQVFRQAGGIFLKNLHNHLSNKKKLAGELLMPILVSLVYYASQSTNGCM